MGTELYPTHTSVTRNTLDNTGLWATSSSGGEINLREEFDEFLYGSETEVAKGQLAIFRRMRKDDNGDLIQCPCVDEKTGEPDRDTVCPYCLTGDAFVTTKTLEGIGYKNIEEILVGDQVLTGDGSFRQVIDKQKRYSSEIVSVKSRLRCDPLKMTPDHVMFVIRKKNYKARKLIVSELQAKELQKGDLLLMPKIEDFLDIGSFSVDWAQFGCKPSTGKKLPKDIPLTEDFLWMIGLWVAEGYIGGDREIIFSLHIKEKDYALRVERTFIDIFPELNVRHILKPETNVRQVRICNSVLAKWFKDNCGSGCENKHFPYFMARLVPSRSIKLVEGLWAGDGSTIHIDKDRMSDRCSIGVTAKEAIYQSQLILWHNGIYAGLSTYQKKNKKRVYKLEWIHENINKCPRQFYEFDNFWATAITSIDFSSSIAQPVYDITVKDNHSFVVNNTLSHNCWGEGYLWDEEWITCYKMLVSSQEGMVRKDSPNKPGISNTPFVFFYLEYSVMPTRYDKIVEVKLDAAGDISLPYIREATYPIATSEDFRSDNGRIEYWRVAVILDSVVSNHQR